MTKSFSLDVEALLPALTMISGAVDRKQAFPILSNFLFQIRDQLLTVSATDLELEFTAHFSIPNNEDTLSFTVPAKKIVDIFKAFDALVKPIFTINEDLCLIKIEKSQFKLAMMPADDYPISHYDNAVVELNIEKDSLLSLLHSTHFAISAQEVRAYLNGMLLEFNPNTITAVATDGHRLAFNQIHINQSVNHHRILLPRKSIQEILKLLSNTDDDIVQIQTGSDNFKVLTKQYTLQSRLIESRFPPYSKAIPDYQDKYAIIDKELLRKALSRMVILANEKSKAVVLNVTQNMLTFIANNQEKEEAQEIIDAETTGDPIKIGINASYLLDVLSHLSDLKIKISFGSESDSILISSFLNENYRYVIMPMKI
jgi:DNA polymerase-3 subunit beta